MPTKTLKQLAEEFMEEDKKEFGEPDSDGDRCFHGGVISFAHYLTEQGYELVKQEEEVCNGVEVPWPHRHCKPKREEQKECDCQHAVPCGKHIQPKKIELIDVSKVRGHWREENEYGNIAGGDDTVKSIKLVAEKINELIDYLNNL